MARFLVVLVVLSGCSGVDPGPAVKCCKTCGPRSKPCGDSCISPTSSCHTYGGCAC